VLFGCASPNDRDLETLRPSLRPLTEKRRQLSRLEDGDACCFACCLTSVLKFKTPKVEIDALEGESGTGGSRPHWEPALREGVMCDQGVVSGGDLCVDRICG
jgi:hypothetical protein